jgi:putative two-component system response regulator
MLRSCGSSIAAIAGADAETLPSMGEQHRRGVRVVREGRFSDDAGSCARVGWLGSGASRRPGAISAQVLVRCARAVFFSWRLKLPCSSSAGQAAALARGGGCPIRVGSRLMGRAGAADSALREGLIEGPGSGLTLREQELKELRILAVDDEESNLLLLRRILERDGYTRVDVTTDASRVVRMFVESRPDLVLLDLHMPGMDGFELMERLRSVSGEGPGVPFLVLTADATQETKRRALSAGARDFLTKPLDRIELLLRVRNLLEVQHLQDRLRDQNANLEDQVAERTRDLEQARLEILERLALAAEYRDDDTQEHAWRIGRISALLASRLGLSDRKVELIRRAAPLHDIGKIGISDTILLKPGRLTDAEFEVIKTHTTIGAEILSGSQSPLLRLAQRIALSHHERWDGAGYPGGLSGERIPLAGRIVAVADVFDALTHERPYKDAWPVDKAVDEVLGQAGRQFDPAVVDAFATLDHHALLSPAKYWEPPTSGRSPRAEARLSAHA